MKTTVLALSLCAALVASTEAAPVKKRRKPGTSTVPPTSSMIVLPALSPVPQVGERAVGELITTEIGGRDLLFFNNAMQSGLIVATLGQLAQKRAESGAIKDVGSALASTQAEENKQLVRLASLKGVTLSTETPEELTKLTGELDKLDASNFDKACMDKIIATSKDSVSAYEMAIESKDPDIKGFSEPMLTVAKEKLRLAERMTGAGAKAAKALFRTGPAGGAPAAATPAPTAVAPATPAPAGKIAPGTPVPAIPAAVKPAAK